MLCFHLQLLLVRAQGLDEALMLVLVHLRDMAPAEILTCPPREEDVRLFLSTFFADKDHSMSIRPV